MQEAAEAQLEQEQELHAAELRSAEASLWSLMAEQAVAYEAQLAAAAHGSTAAGLDVGTTSGHSTARLQIEEQDAIVKHLEEQHRTQVAELQAQLVEAQVLLSQERRLQEDALGQVTTACCHVSEPMVHLNILQSSSELQRLQGPGRLKCTCTEWCHVSVPVVS